MLNRVLLLVLDYLYLYCFTFLDPITWPVYYLGFLYLVKVNSLFFNFGTSQTLYLNLKALLPWSLVFGLISWPLLLFKGPLFWVWFNLWTLFMVSIGYAGYLILFKEFSLLRTLKFLWCRFGYDNKLPQLLGFLLFSNFYMFFKSFFYQYIPKYIFIGVLLCLLFGVSHIVKKKYF